MTVKLLYHIVSPPSRASMFTLKALGIPHELQVVNMFKMEHRAPEYVKINPQHTVPMLDDNGFKIWDSHAVNTYLVDKYGKDDDSLYPKHLEKRAVVNQRLHFDTGVLFASLRNITVPILAEGNLDPIPDEKIRRVEEGYTFTEDLLKTGATDFIADNHVTIADFSVATTLSMLKLLVPTLTEERYPRTTAYLQKCEQTFPSYREIEVTGIEVATKVFAKLGFKHFVKQKI